ncbi:MAG: ubiquinone/menaquinone biosynthesis methyltransferase [Actinomycetia bacterium]|nr:ubiquinone/menaquinone biosynthesis methyltransferase [Actinomycetes bacterium]MCP4227101.1 ubiquinone/menaquinone biosynthesis methyltransferase [Actinomycetes bacterium]MCP5030375.1 ubiquinone/menaquinone biosynthesis methyltransferase [Actinomycetes bacterium]
MSVMPEDRLPHGAEKREAVRSMFDTIAPRYDLVNRLMTFRMDVRWRKTTLQELALPPGATVLDLACGTGDFCVELIKAGHRPLGVDLSYGMLAAARTDAPLVQGDLANQPMVDGAADGAVCGFALRNLVALDPFFAELFRVIRPGGRIGLLDVSQPDNRLLRWGHGIYFNRVVPVVGGLLSDKRAYAYLPRSVSYLPEPDELTSMLETAGFVAVKRRQLSTGITQLLTATRP